MIPQFHIAIYEWCITYVVVYRSAHSIVCDLYCSVIVVLQSIKIIVVPQAGAYTRQITQWHLIHQLGKS